MSLFIGNISSTTKISELEDLFNKYGRSKVALKTNYGFVDYDNIRDAEDALNKCNKKIVAGSEIELKWSDRMNKDRYARGRRHYLRRSRSRSRSKDSRSKRKEDRHRHHRKRSYSNKRKYSRDRSKSINRNDRKKQRRKSRHSNRSDSSKSKSRSRSRSLS